jgi:hypothetical protein
MVWADPVTQMVGVMCPAASEATHNVDYNLISTKTPDQIAMMREAGKNCAQILQELAPIIRSGPTLIIWIEPSDESSILASRSQAHF